MSIMLLFLNDSHPRGCFCHLAVLWSHLFTHIFLQNSIKWETGVMVHSVDWVVRFIAFTPTVHMKVTNKMANSNILQVCVCAPYLLSPSNYTLTCVFEYAYMGAVHTHTNTSPKKRGHTPGVSLQRWDWMKGFVHTEQLAGS